MAAIDTIETEYAAELVPADRIETIHRGTISAVLSKVGNALTKRRTRVHLSELSDELLYDIGVSPTQARRESKRFWWE